MPHMSSRRAPGQGIGARYQTHLQAAKIVVSDLPLAAISRFQKASGLTLERIKEVTRLSDGSLHRRKRSGRLSQEESERLLRLSRIFEHAALLHNGDRAAATQWLETPIPALGRQRPLDM